MNSKKWANLFLIALALALGSPSGAHAGPLDATITYFDINSSDPDAGRLCCYVGNEVKNGLGPDNLPLYIGSSYGGTKPLDVNAAGELTYWTPGTHVAPVGSAMITIPFNNNHMFNPEGTGGTDGGANGFLSAVITANLFVATTETVSFTLASDDNAFVYINGQVVCDDGGVHSATAVTCTSATLNAGVANSLYVFYDDLDPVQAVLDFNITTDGVTTTPTPFNPSPIPEPASLALLAVGLFGVAALRRKS